MSSFDFAHNLFATPDQPSDSAADVKIFLDPCYSPSLAQDLISIAEALVNPRGRGIYATDETPDVIHAAFVGAFDREGEEKARTDEESKERRRRWRKLSYESVSSDYISGVILFEETLLDFQHAPILLSKGIIPGIGVNRELIPFPNSPSEFMVQGLDNLLTRLQAARAAGARFSKWRAPIECTSLESGGLPTLLALETQAETLARFAAISQQAGLVPIVEPDVDFSSDADLAKSVDVHQKIIRMIYDRCSAYSVLLEASLIKPSFPQPGLKHPSRSTTTPDDIALATATVIARSVPASVAGVVFLSGGLAPSVALSYLSSLNNLVNKSPPRSPFSRLPPLSFSYGRAMQQDAIRLWVRGDEAGAQQSLQRMSQACFRAVKGEAEAM